jgi:hypothetical protein
VNTYFGEKPENLFACYSALRCVAQHSGES